MVWAMVEETEAAMVVVGMEGLWRWRRRWWCRWR